MKDPFFRNLCIFAAVFFLCAGILVFLGIRLDTELNTAFRAAYPEASRGHTILGFGLTTTAFVLATVIGSLIYFLPAINALARGHKEKKAITVLNIFLGWTLIGWVAALVWSFTSQVAQPTTHNPQPTSAN